MRHQIGGSAAIFLAGVAVLADESPTRLEQPDNPPALLRPALQTTPPGQELLPLAATPVVRVTQVNVTPSQQNIVGDAANEPSLAHDPTAPSRIAVGWRQFDTIASNFRQAGVAWSNDGGRTWHASTLNPGVFRSDPVLRANSDGVIFYNSLTGDFFGWNFLSYDGGKTWAAPYPAFGGDKTWMAIDRTSGPGRGFLYESWNTAGNNYAPNTFARATDGFFFEDPIQLPVSPVFGTNYVGPNGEVYVFGTPNSSSTSTFYLVKSSNANDALATPAFTWSTVNMGGTARIGGTPNPGGLLGQSQVVVDASNGPRRGWVYLLATVDPVGTDPGDINFVRSTDGGLTFSPPQKINPEPALNTSWQWFGTIGVSPNGRLDVVYNSTDGTGALTNSKLMYISSNDGGTTWSDALQVTNIFNSTVGQPNQNKIGDYYDIESDDLGASVIMSATFTGGQDVYYIRIGPEDCNRNGRDDSVDISFGFDPDCNKNGVPDSCDIASGFSTDSDHNGIPDGCIENCAGDFNLDGQVDDTDFVMFAYSYNVLLCADAAMPPACRADLNHDGLVDDADFVLFVAAYDQLVCG
ncbi:MAG: hypothetical protein KF691_00420 [Phycisphaeraceae bacterium]|nr:hypothetical protein [Phycisphaeraceae bacterium]